MGMASACAFSDSVLILSMYCSEAAKDDRFFSAFLVLSNFLGVLLACLAGVQYLPVLAVCFILASCSFVISINLTAFTEIPSPASLPEAGVELVDIEPHCCIASRGQSGA
eukprot:TRINITY_DN64119_c0_g1_i1.p1 TRINITY_DN64119_c0_g1~~TRINITY_DN64119_c0_g1_i1.p1  ORF type:complete len:110 (-),score=5.25 TRINITY_DN64119_c0_g1_i1:192-521(-)